jgi:hypothetical protein
MTGSPVAVTETLSAESLKTWYDVTSPATFVP